MKNFFKKMKSYSFWVALSSAIVVLLNALGRAFGFSIPNQVVEDVILAIASLLVVFGVVNMNTKSKEQDQTEQEEKEDENLNEKEDEQMNKNTK